MAADTGAGLGDNLVPSAAADHDDVACFLELARDGHHLALRLLHVLQPHRAEILDLLLDDRRRALGHALEDLGGDLVPRGLQREHEILLLHFLDQPLQAPLVHVDEVLEREHQRADVLGERGGALVELAEQFLLRGGIDAVQDLRHRLGAAAVGNAGGGARRDLALEHLLDLLDDLRAGLVHRRHAQDDLGPDVGGQPRDDGGARLGLEAREHEGDHLRVLAAEDARELVRIGLLHRGEAARLDGGLDAADDLDRAVAPDGLVENGQRVGEPARGDVLLGQRHLEEFRGDRGGRRLVHVGQPADLRGEHLDLLLREALEDLGRHVGAQAGEQDRRLLRAGDGFELSRHRVPLPPATARASSPSRRG